MRSAQRLASATIHRAPAPIREQVANYLRNSITNMELLPGTVLVEREICEATSVSRATVREALRQLESEGLVSSESGKGTYVAELSKQEAEEIYQVRAELEGLAALLFAQRASDDQVQQLVKITANMEKAVDDAPQMIQLKRSYYRVLFQGAGNRELKRLVESLKRRITLVQVNSLSLPGRPSQTILEIQAINEAFISRDAVEAKILTIHHIHCAAKAVLDAADSRFAS